MLVIETENSFRTLSSSAAVEKTLTTHCRKTMTIVTIKERIMMIEGIKKRRSSFLFSMATSPTLKKGTTQTFVWKCKFVGVARAPTGSNQLKAGPGLNVWFKEIEKPSIYGKRWAQGNWYGCWEIQKRGITQHFDRSEPQLRAVA